MASYDEYEDLLPVPVTKQVQGLLDRRHEMGGYELSRQVNQVLQSEGVTLVADRRRRAAEVADWESEASAPTGMYPDAQEMADQVRSEMDGEYDRGRDELGRAVQAARASHKVLLDPATCKMVVDLDHDDRMTRTMGVDVQEVFGVNPAYDPGAAGRLAEMRANAGVDFSRGVQPGRQAPQTTPSQRAREVDAARARQAHRAGPAPESSTRERTPIRAALVEEINRLRAERAVIPGQIEPEDSQLG